MIFIVVEGVENELPSFRPRKSSKIKIIHSALDLIELNPNGKVLIKNRNAHRLSSLYGDSRDTFNGKTSLLDPLKKELLKTGKILIPNLLKLEEVNEKNYHGKLKKFERELFPIVDKQEALNIPSLKGNSISSLDLGIWKLDRRISQEKRKGDFFLENLKVIPAKILEKREFESDTLRKRKQGLLVKYRLTKKKPYIWGVFFVHFLGKYTEINNVLNFTKRIITTFFFH